MMLAGEDDALDAGLLADGNPLVAIQSGGVEGLGRHIAVAPFHVVEGVHAEMDKGSPLHLLPGYLVLGWTGPEGCWRRCLLTGR